MLAPRALVALGIAQCVNWGVLYYAFAVFVLPLERTLKAPTWVVTGAFSLALLASALLAPLVGRLSDRGHGPLVMQGGGLLAALFLVLSTLLPSLATLYLVWIGIGFCMAATLYEPAFVIVGRAYADSDRRLRALAAITLLGGLASTVFLPLTSVLVSSIGWRNTTLVLAALMVMSTMMLRAMVFRHLPNHHAATGSRPPPHQSRECTRDSPAFVFISVTFTLVSLTSAAFTANLIPALSERGVPMGTAAIVGGLMGAMQLPGRALLMHGAFTDSAPRLLALSLVLQAAGLGSVALAPSTLVVACGALVFAMGGGLTTLLRPHLVLTVSGAGGEGHSNGRIARRQQLARALGPVGVAWLASILGYSSVFAGFATAFALVALSLRAKLAGIHRFGLPKEAL